NRKRPDILAYVSEREADLVLDAEIIIESKMPEEITKYGGIVKALTADEFWADKTFPYLIRNISKVQYFGLTTFTDFAFFPVTQQLRADLVEMLHSGKRLNAAVQTKVATSIVRLPIEPQSSKSAAAVAEKWSDWMTTH